MRDYTISCVDHGEMERDEERKLHACASCEKVLPDEQLFRIVRAVAKDNPEITYPLPIVVP